MPARNQHLLDTASPPIPRIQAWGREYTGTHGPLLNLCQAVPAYPPPPDMLERLAEAAGNPASAAYGPIAGDDHGREASRPGGRRDRRVVEAVTAQRVAAEKVDHISRLR